MEDSQAASLVQEVLAAINTSAQRDELLACLAFIGQSHQNKPDLLSAQTLASFPAWLEGQGFSASLLGSLFQDLDRIASPISSSDSLADIYASLSSDAPVMLLVDQVAQRSPILYEALLQAILKAHELTQNLGSVAGGISKKTSLEAAGSAIALSAIGGIVYYLRRRARPAEEQVEHVAEEQVEQVEQIVAPRLDRREERVEQQVQRAADRDLDRIQLANYQDVMTHVGNQLIRGGPRQAYHYDAQLLEHEDNPVIENLPRLLGQKLDAIVAGLFTPIATIAREDQRRFVQHLLALDSFRAFNSELRYGQKIDIMRALIRNRLIANGFHELAQNDPRLLDYYLRSNRFRGETYDAIELIVRDQNFVANFRQVRLELEEAARERAATAERREMERVEAAAQDQLRREAARLRRQAEMEAQAELQRVERAAAAEQQRQEAIERRIIEG